LNIFSLTMETMTMSNEVEGVLISSIRNGQ
jgi:hypothetical protein